MIIAHLTDSHIGLDLNVLGGPIDPTEALRQALIHVRRLNPAPQVLLMTGDMTNSGCPHEYATMVELLDQELGAARKRGLRVLFVPGNHGDRGFARQALQPYMPVADEAPPGDCICVTTAVGGLHFIGLDTVQPGHPHGALDGEQLDWLARALERRAGQPVVLFMHHPPIATGIEAMDHYGLLRGRAELTRLVLAHGGVQLIACGHVHRPIVGVLGGAPVVVAPSTGHQLELDLRPGAPLAVRLEPPMIGVYRWTPGDGMTCHFAHVQVFQGPFLV